MQYGPANQETPTCRPQEISYSEQSYDYVIATPTLRIRRLHIDTAVNIIVAPSAEHGLCVLKKNNRRPPIRSPQLLSYRWFASCSWTCSVGRPKTMLVDYQVQTI